jgi:hypothetical protein
VLGGRDALLQVPSKAAHIRLHINATDALDAKRRES